jgi:hypothetical protein
MWGWLATALAGELKLEVDTVDFTASENLERSIAPVLTRLHAMHEDWLGLALPSLVPLDVRIYANGERFGVKRHEKGDEVAERIGYFEPWHNRIHVWHRGDDEETKGVLQHEVTHYLTQAAGLSKVPPWLREGLAEVGASARLDERQLVWLEPLPGRMASLARRPRPRASALVGLDEATWDGLGVAPQYAYGWALCAFFVESEAGRRTLSEILLVTASGSDPGGSALAAVERRYPGGVAAMDTDFAAWRPTRVQIPPRATGPTSDGWGRCPDGSLVRLDSDARCGRWLPGPDGVLRYVEEQPVP